MKVTYISHSAFLVETKNYYLLFDLDSGEVPPLDNSKILLVFASHVHGDHYNPRIFEMVKQYPEMKIKYILSADIERRFHLQKIPEIYPEIFKNVTLVKPHNTYLVDREMQMAEKMIPSEGAWLHTLKSTDKGVAYLVSVDDVLVYHAGDLNEWIIPGESKAKNNDMRARYRREIDYLKSMLANYNTDKTVENKILSAAFLPLDPRLGEYYGDGFLYFMKQIPCTHYFPMHMWGRYEWIDKFIESKEVNAILNIGEDSKSMKRIEIMKIEAESDTFLNLI